MAKLIVQGVNVDEYITTTYKVSERKYKGRKIWSMIDLFSHKNDNAWGNMGRSFIRSILNSSHGFTDNDKSTEALASRKIESFADLDCLEFVAKIDIKKDIYLKSLQFSVCGMEV